MVIVAIQEIGVGDGQGGGGDAAHVELAARAEDDPGGIDQHDLPIGREPSEDSARVLADDAVQGDAGGAGLLEGNGGVLADVEAPPVGDDLLGLLMDGHPVAGLLDAGGPGDHPPARGQGVGRGGRRLGGGGGETEEEGGKGREPTSGAGPHPGETDLSGEGNLFWEFQGKRCIHGVELDVLVVFMVRCRAD